MTPVWQALASGAGTELSMVLTAGKATMREQGWPPAPLGTHTCPRGAVMGHREAGTRAGSLNPPPDLQVRNGELSKDAGGKAELGAASGALADLRRQRAPLASGRDWGRGGTLGQRPGRASVGAASPWRELKLGHSGCRKQRPARLSWALAQPTHVHPLQSPAAPPLGGLRPRAEPPGQGPSGVSGAASEQRGELLFKTKGLPSWLCLQGQRGWLQSAGK